LVSRGREIDGVGASTKEPLVLQRRSVLVVSGNRNLRRRVTRALASAGFSVDCCAASQEEFQSHIAVAPAMCIVDADEPEGAVRWILDTLYRSYADVVSLLLSHDHRSSFILDLLSATNLSNLIAKHGAITANLDLIDESELIVTCQKLFARDIFGLEKYLPIWGIEIHDRVLRATDDKYTVKADIARFLDDIDCSGPIKNSVALVADELIMNAIFNAPRSGVGEGKYTSVERREHIVLEPQEEVTVRYACDGKNVLLSVRDQFGSLTRDVIVKYLERCFDEGPAEIEQKKAGAGLGLYLVFQSITQLTFNIHMGHSTEVIAIFYVRSGSRAFKQSGRSLNIFLLQ
jgi:hypothetical protein